MGVLEDLQDRLSGSPRASGGAPGGVHDVLIETELPKTKGAFTLLLERMSQRRVVPPDEPITMPKKDEAGNVVLPTISPEMAKYVIDPTKTPEAVAAARAAKVRQTNQVTIGPRTPEMVSAETSLPMGTTAGSLAGSLAREQDDLQSVGKLAIVSQTIDRLIGAVEGGAGKTAHALAKAATWIGKATGQDKSAAVDLLSQWSTNQDFFKDYFNAKAGKMPGAIETAADVSGSLLWDIPQIIAMGPWGLAVHGAAYGLADGGVPGMIQGGITGALTHGIFRGINALPSILQMPVATGVGGLMAAQEGGDVKDVLTGAATWGILAKPKMPGTAAGVRAELGEFASRYPEVTEGIKQEKAKRAIKKLYTTGITKEEFILRFPEMRPHMNDRMAEGIMRSLVPEMDPLAVKEAGGAMKVMDFTLSRLTHEYNLAADMVRQSFSLPDQKTAAALQNLAEKMNDQSIVANHARRMAEVADGSGGAMAYWDESILHGEINKRGLEPLQTGRDYVAEKYGPQGWDEITGHTEVERQAIASLQAELSRRGILTGRAAAAAEGDNEAGPGPINPSILRAAYESKLSELMGLAPLRSSTEWLDYFRGKGIPKRARLVQTAEAGDPFAKQLMLSLRKGPAFWTAQGYGMVVAPEGHPGTNSRGMIQQHRLLLEAKIGRILTIDEVAHHRDHIPWNNSPDNLEVMTRDQHLRHHASQEGRAIDVAIMAEAVERGPRTHFQIEDYSTGEMRPVPEGTQPGPREVLHKIQSSERMGGVKKEAVAFGDEIEPWERQQASRGAIQAGPGQEAPEGVTPPGTSETYMGPNKFVMEKNGDVTFVANVRGPDGNTYSRELTRLTPDEAMTWVRLTTKGVENFGQKMGELIDTIVDRVSMNRPAGGKLPAKTSPATEAEPSYSLQQIKPPFESRFADESSRPGAGWVLEKDGVAFKLGPGLTARDLDAYYPPKVKEPPAGVDPWPESLLLHSDFKDREQLTVRDVFDSHKEFRASTVNMWAGNMAGRDMWAVSLYPERTTKIKGVNITEKDIYNFIRKNADLLSSDPRLNVGTWWEEKTDTTYIDVTALLPLADGKLVEELGRKYNQKAVTLLDKDLTFPSVETGGTGEPLPEAGWLPEAQRLNEIYKTGDMTKLYHFGQMGEVSPQAMGKAQMGEERLQFEEGYTGRRMLKPGFLLKSNFYTPEAANVEAHRWGGQSVGTGEIDKGQLFDASKARGKESLDMQAILAGKRGWFDPRTNQIRLFTPIEIERLGKFKGAWQKSLRGSEIESLVEKDSPNLVEEPGAPKEDYGNSQIFNRQRGSIQTSGQDVIDTVSRLRFLLFDKFSPVHDLMKMAKKAGLDIPIMENPSVLVKLLGGVSGRAEARVFYKNFSVSPDGEILWKGKSLNNIFSPHKGDMAGFDDYLIYRAAIEEEALNASRPADERVETGIDPVEAQRYVQANAAKYDASAKEFTSYFHTLLDEMFDAGLIDAETLDGWKTTRPNYAPLRRDLEMIAGRLDQASGSNSARQTLDRVQNPVKKRRGSELPVLPPTQAAVMMTYEITSAIERNRAAQAIVNMRNLSPEFADLIKPTRPRVTYARDITTGKDVPTIGRQEANTVAVSFDGKRQFFSVPQDLAESMKLLYETGLGRWTKLMAIPARTLRTGATAAPEFAFRNPLRDWLTAFMNAKKGFNPIIDFPKGLFDMLGQSDQYWKWKAAGGEWSMLVSLDKSLGDEAVRKMHQQTDTGLKALRKYIKSPVGYLEKLSEMGEKPTRLGVFGRSRKKGMSDIEAAVESREASTDFAVRGAETKSVAATYVFLNAKAQTTLKLGRTALDNPVKFALKGMAAAGLPSLVLYAINRDDPEYWKRDQMERDLFWFLPLEIGGRQVKIPKGEIGLIFGTSVEKVLQALDSKAETRPAVDKYLAEVWQNMMPVGNAGEFLPTFARPIAEWINNKSYYYGTPLEPESDEAVAPYLRYKPGTSETMKSLGKALGAFNRGEGVSPIKMENTLRGITGGVGRHTLRLIDMAADAAGIQDRGAKPSDPMNIPGLAGFVSRRASGFESEPAKVFYKTAEAVEMTKRTLDELIKQKGERAEEVLTWIRNHPIEMKLIELTKLPGETGQVTSLFTKVKTDLADLRKLENMISENKGLSAKQKREALDVLDRRVSALVDPMWKLINAASSRAKGSKE